MVDGVSKLDQIEFNSREDAQAESFRKMLLAMAQDVRVILIKLADRLHNMRTLDAMAPPHRRRIARETLDIYAPIANRLGLNALYLELQDLAFKHLYPMRFRILANAIKAARGNRREVMNRLLDVIRDGFAKAGITARRLGTREDDLFGLQEDGREALHVLAGLRHLRRARAGRGHDRLLRGARRAARPLQADPRQVQGLHRDPQGQRLPVAAHHAVRPVRHAAGSADTHARHAPDRGDGRRRALALQDRPASSTSPQAQRETHRWLQSLLEIQSESRDSKEFLENIKGDLFPDEIYVFTPKGKIMALPRGATAVDFAYAVHTDVGHHCVAARINYELMPLRTELKNGDHVEILTSPIGAAQSVVAVVRRHRQGALAHPPLPEGPAAEGIGGARRAAARAGARDAQGRAGVDHRGNAGRRCRRNSARRASSTSSPTSGSASGCRSSSRRRCTARGRQDGDAGAHARGDRASRRR